MRFESKEVLAAHFGENPDLQSLELENCPGITSLPSLPSPLTELRVSNCPEITGPLELPSLLTYLLVDNCSGMTKGGALKAGKLKIEIR